jgi:hypothetical protein
VVDGAAGPIAILGAAARLGIGGEPARATLEAAHRALWSAGSADRGAQVSPTSWGGGDIGIAAVLAATQQGAPRVRAIERAHAIARRADPAAATDPSLVRGTAGVAHALNRLFQATGDRVFGDAARAWFERTIALFDPARGLGGYRFWQAPWQNAYIPELSTGWVDAPGLIGGIAGVGLALLAACEPIEPAWDRVLLLSTREAA